MTAKTLGHDYATKLAKALDLDPHTHRITDVTLNSPVNGVVKATVTLAVSREQLRRLALLTLGQADPIPLKTDGNFTTPDGRTFHCDPITVTTVKKNGNQYVLTTVPDDQPASPVIPTAPNAMTPTSAPTRTTQPWWNRVKFW